MKTKLIKLAALVLAGILFAGVCACSATEDNPSIGSVGDVKFHISDYTQYYNMYAYYASYMPDLNGYIKQQLINYGVTLNHCHEIGMTLDAEEENELNERVEKQIKTAAEGMTVDSSITDATEKYNAQLDKLKQQLKQNGTSFEKYKKDIADELRNTMLMEKLRRQIDAEVQFGSEQVQKYYDENAPKAEEQYSDVSKYREAYNSYLTGSGVLPLFTPDDMFNVKQLLIQFNNHSQVSDTVEGEFTEEQNKLIDEVRDALKAGISLEDFMNNYVLTEKYNNDPVFNPPELEEGEEETLENDQYLLYREHGYIMNEKLIEKYYDGFGAAACLLYYGEDWKIPEPETTPAPDSTDAPTTDAPATDVPATDAPATGAPATDAPTTEEPEETADPIEKYSIKFYNTTDGVKIAEVRTNVAGGGIHFIFISEELEPGQVKLDINDTQSEVYKSIEKIYRKQLEDEHYAEVFNTWKENTKIRLNEKYIDSFARDILRIGGTK